MVVSEAVSGVVAEALRDESLGDEFNGFVSAQKVTRGVNK
jgi:hypothetical protein